MGLWKNIRRYKRWQKFGQEWDTWGTEENEAADKRITEEERWQQADEYTNELLEDYIKKQ